MLYHGSPHRLETALEPKHGLDDSQGKDRPLVFATESLAIAMAYTLNDKEHFLQCYHLDDVPLVVIKDPEGLQEKLADSAVYQVESESFKELVTSEGLRTAEYITDQPVHIVSKVGEVPDLETAMQHTVQIFVLNAPTEEAAAARASHIDDSLPQHERQLKIFKGLVDEGVLVHLNAEQGYPALDLATGTFPALPSLENALTELPAEDRAALAGDGITLIPAQDGESPVRHR